MSNSWSRATSHYVLGCLFPTGRTTAAVTMAHGFAGIREHGLDKFAQVYAEAGFAVLVHDHRGFGASDGQPRCDVDPWRQTDDPAIVGHTRQYLLDVPRLLDEKPTPVSISTRCWRSTLIA